MDCRLAAGALALALCAFAVTIVEAAVDENVSLSEQERFERGLIEVHYPPDYLAPYRERRTPWAPVFGLNYQNVVPVGFVSDFADENNNSIDYATIFGSAAVPMVSYFGGVQFSFGGISVAPTVGMSMGQVSGGKYNTSLSVNMQTLGVTLNMDSIMNEPYVVPTATFAINRASYVENADGGANSSSDTTSPFFSYTVGALIQLNWVDPAGAFEGLKESGLNNTFIHVFGGQLMASGGDSTSFASNMSLGAGVRLEF